MHLSAILAILPAALAMATPHANMKRQDFHSAIQQVEAACFSARSAIEATGAQDWEGSASEGLDAIKIAVDGHCAGLRDALGRVAAAGPSNFADQEGAAGDVFDTIG